MRILEVKTPKASSLFQYDEREVFGSEVNRRLYAAASDCHRRKHPDLDTGTPLSWNQVGVVLDELNEQDYEVFALYGLRVVRPNIVIHFCEESVVRENAESDIVTGKFVTVWDNGYELATECKVNLKTREVFDICTVEGSATEEFTHLDDEYVKIPGKNVPLDVLRRVHVHDGESDVYEDAHECEANLGPNDLWYWA